MFIKIILLLIVLCVILSFAKLELPFNKRVQIVNNIPVLLSEKYYNPTRINKDGKTIYFFRYFIYKSFSDFLSKVIVIEDDNFEKETELSFNYTLKTGYEDARAIVYNNDVYLFLTGRNDETDIFEMFITKYNPDQKLEIKKIYPFTDKGHKKNFMPFISNDKMYFIFSTTPEYVIMEMETKNGEITGNIKEILRKDNSVFENIKGEGRLALKNNYLKGNTKGCLYGKYLYFVVHKTFIYTGSVKYYVNHILVIQKNYPFDIIALSQPFILTDSEIILADLYNPFIMFINFGFKNINFITDMEICPDGIAEFLYGYKDKESYSVKCKLSDIINL